MENTNKDHLAIEGIHYETGNPVRIKIDKGIFRYKRNTWI